MGTTYYSIFSTNVEFISQTQYPLGCLSPNKESSVDVGEPRQGQCDTLLDNVSEQGEYSRLMTEISSETSSRTSLHSSLGEDDKQNNTRDQMSEAATNDKHNGASENLMEAKDKLSGVKRKLTESDSADAVCFRRVSDYHTTGMLNSVSQTNRKVSRRSSPSPPPPTHTAHLGLATPLVYVIVFFLCRSPSQVTPKSEKVHDSVDGY